MPESAWAFGTRMAPARHRHAGGGGGPRESTESVHPPEADMPSNAGYFTDGVQKRQEFRFVSMVSMVLARLRGLGKILAGQLRQPC